MPARAEMRFHPPLPERGEIVDRLSPQEEYEMRNLSSFDYLALRTITPPDDRIHGSSVLLTPEGVRGVEDDLKAAQLFPAGITLSRVERRYVKTPTVDGTQFDFVTAGQEPPILAVLLFDALYQSGSYGDYRIAAHVHRPADPTAEVRATIQTLINTFEKTHDNQPRIAAAKSVITQIGRRQAHWE